MKMLRILALLAVASPSASFASDETHYLKGAVRVLEKPGDYMEPGSATLSYKKAQELVRLALPGASHDDPNFYCMIHVLLWGDTVGEIKESKWYLYRNRGDSLTPSGPWTPARFQGSRIYGSTDLALLYLHLNVPMRSKAEAERQLVARYVAENPAKHEDVPTLKAEAAEVAAALVSDDPEAIVRVNATLAGKKIEVAVPSQLESARKKKLAVVSGYFVEQDYLGVSYQVDVVKKLPAPIQNITDALGLFQSERAEVFAVETEPGAVYGAREFEIVNVPSDIKVTGKVTTAGALGKTTELGASSYDNEGLYYWDVSVGIPVNRINELDFTAADGKVFAKEVDKQNLFLLFNVFWRPVDTKNLQYRLLPSPLVGIGISKKPLDKVFVGASIGLNKVQVYGGLLWNRVRSPATLAPGDAALEATLEADLKPRYDRKFLVGINVPVRQVVDFLKKK